MKLNFILAVLLLFYNSIGYSQYIGVKARYTETRLVDDAPNPPKRENRLILSFYTVSDLGIYTPTVLTNYDLWVYKQGLQYGSYCGGVLDSCSNNYPGYSYTAPKAVAYYNSYYHNWIDCDPNAATHYVVNGHELDCGFITVSYWDIDYGTGAAIECFPAPNVCLRYYHPWEFPYGLAPGNVNFTWPVPPTAPYNWYSFACYQSTQQLVIRGVLPHDTSLITLPVRFDHVRASLMNDSRVKLEWSNLTESDINYYEAQRATDGQNFQTIGLVFPLHNNGGKADYTFVDNAIGSGNYYYRIKALENSRTILYSHVLRISNSIAAKALLTVYPNPITNGQLNFQVTNLPAGKYKAVLVNMTGQEKLIYRIDHPGGSFSQSQHLSSLAAGMYQFILRSPDITLSQKIIITR
ncbi:MAG: T9SS type A sorting domain-containing protein [Sphingobacteriales bacterium]|nr:T9SS type A sorting domain-containing protein [Sphingobacteriales bacterium]OJW01194.1 MAG: hypothetical protein BGO52_07115 [Sphingobacteriales bacterium 44-61]